LVGQFQVGRPAGDEALRHELMAAAPHAFRQRDKTPRASAPAAAATRLAPAARPAPVRAKAASAAPAGEWTEF
jgi:hypothetical protein